jgi:hypothetical protein
MPDVFFEIYNFVTASDAQIASYTLRIADVRWRNNQIAVVFAVACRMRAKTSSQSNLSPVFRSGDAQVDTRE